MWAALLRQLGLVNLCSKVYFIYRVVRLRRGSITQRAPSSSNPSPSSLHRTTLQIFGEYLHICYFSFYFILGGTWPLAWVICAREHFDTVTVTVAGAYLLCLGSYLVMPVKGPFWTYERPDPAEVGYLFSYLTHAIDKSGSSHGT